MQGLALIVSVVAMGLGFGAAGIVGMLTGFVAAVGTGSGLAIAVAERGTGVKEQGPARTAQRMGGLVSAAACLGGAYYGGWASGWLWGGLGYIAGVGVSVVAAILPRVGRQMAFFKKKLEVAAAMRLMLRPVVGLDSDRALSEISSAGHFSDAEIERLHSEIVYLMLALWHMRFLEVARTRRVSIEPEDLTHRFMAALVSTSEMPASRRVISNLRLMG